MAAVLQKQATIKSTVLLLSNLGGHPEACAELVSVLFQDLSATFLDFGR